MTNETLEELGRFAERKYLERLNNYKNRDFSDGVIEGAKWQQERSYSEEEVLKFGEIMAWNIIGRPIAESSIKIILKQLFKQFKK